MARKSYSGAASATTLASAITSSSATISVVNATGYPSSSDPFVIVLGRGTNAEEKVLIASVAGNAFTVASSGRGYDATIAQSHASGETVEHCIDSITINEANAHVNDIARDDHTQYLNNTRHDTTARHAFGGALGTPSAPPSVTTASAAGSASTPARSDHTHGIANGAINNAAQLGSGVVTIGGALTAPAAPANVALTAAAGTATNAARADHVHILDSTIAGPGLTYFAGALIPHVDAVTVHVNGSNQLEVVPNSGTVSDGSITTAKLASAAVTTAKIANGNITAALLDSATAMPRITVGRMNPSGTTNVNSTVLVNWPPAGAGGPLSVTFTKVLAATKITVQAAGTGYKVNDAGNFYTFTLAVYDGATATTLATWSLKALTGESSYFGGSADLGALSAGAHTLTLQLKSSSAGSAFETAVANHWEMRVTESF